MDEQQEKEWIAQCAYQLRQRWRTVDTRSLEEVAAELFADDSLRSKAPRVAALEWMRRGIPTA